MKRTKKKPRPPINIEELTMAKLAGEINTTLKVHLEPSKRVWPKMEMKVVGTKRRVDYISPYDALTRFDVTITGQVLDIPFKIVNSGVLISQVSGCVEDVGTQLQWVVQNRLQELKMKYDYETPVTIPVKDML